MDHPKACDRPLQALIDCQKKHPRQPIVCESLEKAYAWCVFSHLCPSEVEDLETCCGRRGSTAFRRSGPPPSIPRSCHPQVLRMEACLTEQQTKLEQQQQQRAQQQQGQEAKGTAAGKSS